MVAGTTYYVIKDSATTIRLASSVSNAKAGTDINITTVGTGTHTVTVTLSNRTLGSDIGEEAHLLTVSEMPDHNHSYTRNNILSDVNITGSATSTWRQTASDTTGSAGGNNTHNIMQPTLFAGSTFIFTGV